MNIKKLLKMKFNKKASALMYLISGAMPLKVKDKITLLNF